MIFDINTESANLKIKITINKNDIVDNLWPLRPLHLSLFVSISIILVSFNKDLPWPWLGRYDEFVFIRSKLAVPTRFTRVMILLVSFITLLYSIKKLLTIHGHFSCQWEYTCISCKYSNCLKIAADVNVTCWCNQYFLLWESKFFQENFYF